MSKRQYYELSDLEEVYLEDSYVLNIEETSSLVEFSIEVVLREGHPRYHSPLPGEQYCYEKAKLRFPNPTKVTWSGREKAHAFADASGKTDYGNIDEFLVEEGNFHLAGDWGSVDIESQYPELVFGD